MGGRESSEGAVNTCRGRDKMLDWARVVVMKRKGWSWVRAENWRRNQWPRLMDGMWGQGLVTDFWTGHVNWTHRRRERSRFGWMQVWKFSLWFTELDKGDLGAAKEHVKWPVGRTLD